MTTNPYGHARAAEPGACTCGRSFSTGRGLTQHVNGAYRAWAKTKAAEEAGLRAEARAAATATAVKDYRESITFHDGDLWRAVNKTFMASSLLVLVSVESAMDETGHVTHTLHSKDEPATWSMDEFELWAFFRTIANGDLLDLASLAKRYRASEVALNIVATMMFLFFDPKGETA